MSMGSTAVHAQLLQDLARHEDWADNAHWKALHENSTLLEDPEIRARLSHMLMALRTLTALARGETPDPSGMKNVEPPDQLEATPGKANVELIEALDTIDLQKMISLPRGPQGPWDAPAGVLLLQAITPSQNHRGQKASRIRQAASATTPLCPSAPTDAPAPTPTEFRFPRSQALWQAKGSIAIGSVGMIQQSYSVTLGGQTTKVNTLTATATFNRYTSAQLTTSPTLLGIPSAGSCLEVPFLGTNTPVTGSTPGLGLDAGRVITLTTPSLATVNLAPAPSVTGSYAAATGTVPSLVPGTYKITGTGGADIGSFQATLNLVQPLIWTNQAAITTSQSGGVGIVNRSQPLTVTWTGGDPNGFAGISGFSLAGTASTAPGGFFYCMAPIAPGQFTIPASALLALPPTGANTPALLFVGSSSVEQPFSAPGLDFAITTASIFSGASVIFQ
jgi:hypothetical protein